MQNPDLVLTPMRGEHVADTVQIHLDSFPDFFSTFLGPKYISIVYSEILCVPDHVALIAENVDGTVLGFVIGMTDQTSFFSHMARKHWLRIALASLQAALKRPRIIPRLFRSLLYPQKSREAAAKALLLSMAVSPAASRVGVGRQLLEAFLVRMKELDVPAVCLTTDAHGNEIVNRFYRSAGFRLARAYTTAEGRRVNEYLIKLIDGTE